MLHALTRLFTSLLIHFLLYFISYHLCAFRFSSFLCFCCASLKQTAGPAYLPALPSSVTAATAVLLTVFIMFFNLSLSSLGYGSSFFHRSITTSSLFTPVRFLIALFFVAGAVDGSVLPLHIAFYALVFFFYSLSLYMYDRLGCFSL